MTEVDLKQLLAATPEMMAILKIIAQLGLADAWLSAGCIRNMVWNYLSKQPLFDHQTDVDVVFFDKAISYSETEKMGEALQKAYPQYDWELKNQAHMHLHNPNTQPYQSACDAIAKFPETCTAIAARWTETDGVVLFTPYGLSDMMNFCVRPTPFFSSSPEKLGIYKDRMLKKNWQEKWPNLTILLD